MASTTIYDVILRYKMQDQAKNDVKELRHEVEKAGRQSSMLGRSLRFAAGAAVGFFGFRAAKSALVDFNVGMESARVQMAGLLQLNAGGDFAMNMGRANDLVGKLQQRAKKSVGTTQDMVQMASMITRPVTAAGLGMKELEEITAGAAVAARAFGIQAEVAALDIEQALMGNLAKKDRFARALLEPMGITTQAFNKMAASDRAKTLLKAFRQDAIKDMADAQANTFAGQVSTLKDNLQIALGKVGLPLMQAITSEVQKWNEWIDKHPEKIRTWTKALADTLVQGFRFLKDVASFIFRNRALLMTVAKSFLAFKAFKVGLTAVGKHGIIGSVMVPFVNALKGAVNPVQSFTMKMNAAVIGLSALAAGAQFLADHILKSQDKTIQRQQDTAFIRDQAARMLSGQGGVRTARSVIGGLGREGALDARGQIDPKKLGELFGLNKAGRDLLMGPASRARTAALRGALPGMDGDFRGAADALEAFRMSQGLLDAQKSMHNATLQILTWPGVIGKTTQHLTGLTGHIEMTYKKFFRDFTVGFATPDRADGEALRRRDRARRPGAGKDREEARFQRDDQPHRGRVRRS